uniref:Reverse transcriptase domain-containing protein n=1 Tax=Steinernema glaseri TaxID=37863 RepID=A0A1I7YAW5_9BILA
MPCACMDLCAPIGLHPGAIRVSRTLKTTSCSPSKQIIARGRRGRSKSGENKLVGGERHARNDETCEDDKQHLWETPKADGSGLGAIARGDFAVRNNKAACSPHDDDASDRPFTSINAGYIHKLQGAQKMSFRRSGRKGEAPRRVIDRKWERGDLSEVSEVHHEEEQQSWGPRFSRKVQGRPPSSWRILEKERSQINRFPRMSRDGGVPDCLIVTELPGSTVRYRLAASALISHRRQWSAPTSAEPGYFSPPQETPDEFATHGCPREGVTTREGEARAPCDRSPRALMERFPRNRRIAFTEFQVEWTLAADSGGALRRRVDGVNWPSAARKTHIYGGAPRTVCIP